MHAALLIAGAALLASCSSITVVTDYDPDVDFAALQTWNFAPEPESTGNVVVDTDDLFKERVRKAIETELAAKGYRFQEQSPDFHVAFFLVVKDKTNVTTINSYYGYGPGWGWGYGAPVGGATETMVDNYQEGTLLIDVSRDPGHKLAWRGTGTTRLSERKRTPEESTQAVNEAVSKILAKFPPEAKKK